MPLSYQLSRGHRAKMLKRVSSLHSLTSFFKAFFQIVSTQKFLNPIIRGCDAIGLKFIISCFKEAAWYLSYEWIMWSFQVRLYNLVFRVLKLYLNMIFLFYNFFLTCFPIHLNTCNSQIWDTQMLQSVWKQQQLMMDYIHIPRLKPNFFFPVTQMCWTLSELPLLARNSLLHPGIKHTQGIWDN